MKIEKSSSYVPGLIYYGACYLLYNVGLFGAATYLPLAELQGVATIAGIVFAILQSRLLFNNDITKSNVGAAVVCVVGIALTAQPQWLFKKGLSTSDTAGISFINSSFSAKPQNTSAIYGSVLSSHEVLLGYTLSILGGAALGVSFDINGIILCNVKTIPKIVYTMLVCMVGSTAFMFYLEGPVYVLDFKQFLLVLGHSATSAVESFLAIYAGSIIPGPSFSILVSFEVVTMLVSQYTLMHSIKPGNYNWIEVLGCVIIVFGASVPGVVDLLSYRAKANELP